MLPDGAESLVTYFRVGLGRPRVSASQAILDRAYGKSSTLNTSDPTVMKRAIDMTDDELAAIASRATLHVVK